MKNVVIVAPMESNGRYRGGIMTVANTIFNNRNKFEEYEIRLDKFNTYIRKRKAESIGKVELGNLLNMLDIIKGLMKVTGKGKCDVLYYHSSIKMALMKDLLVIRVLRLFGKKQRIVLHIHFAEIEKILSSNKIIKTWMLRILKNRVDHIVFLSEETRNEFVCAGISKDKTSVIYNFHDGLADSKIVNRRYTDVVEKKKLDFIFMGSIEKRKGILDLMTAIERKPDEVILHVCGSCSDDSVKSSYETKIKNLHSSVIDHGFVTGREKEELLLNADCLILPSYGEGFPLVLVDAMAKGCACIATPVGAVPEFFKEPDNGYLFTAGNIDELSSCIHKVSHDRKQTAYQMKKNYELAEAFSLDRFIELLCRVM